MHPLEQESVHGNISGWKNSPPCVIAVDGLLGKQQPRPLQNMDSLLATFKMCALTIVVFEIFQCLSSVGGGKGFAHVMGPLGTENLHRLPRGFATLANNFLKREKKPNFCLIQLSLFLVNPLVFHYCGTIRPLLCLQQHSQILGRLVRRDFQNFHSSKDHFP